jgi:outer membrane receptor protein involved in Fe transport
MVPSTRRSYPIDLARRAVIPLTTLASRRIILGQTRPIFAPAVVRSGHQGQRKQRCAALRATAATDASDTTLEPMTVTAERRSESIQEVPLSVTAISGDTLQKFDDRGFHRLRP